LNQKRKLCKEGEDRKRGSKASTDIPGVYLRQKSREGKKDAAKKSTGGKRGENHL